MKKLVLWFLVGIIVVSVSYMGISCKEAVETTEAAEAETTEAAEAETTEAPEAETTEVSTEQVTIRLAYEWYSEGPNFVKWIDGVVEDFHEQNPNIKIEIETGPWTEFWTKFDAQLAAGTAPDIINWSGQEGKYIAEGVLAPLDDLINMDDIDENFNPIQTEIIPSIAKDGKTYMVATDIGLYLPLYRPSVLKKYGVTEYAKTPEEFIEMLEKLKEGGIIPYMTYPMDPADPLSGLLTPLTWVVGFGGDFAKDGLPTLNSPEVIQAMTLLKEFFDAELFPFEQPPGLRRKMFGQGEIGTILDGMFCYGLAVDADPSAKGDFLAAPMPTPTQNVSGYYEGLSITKQSKHPKEAAKVLEAFISLKAQKDLQITMGFLSIRDDVINDKSFQDDYLKENPWYQEFLDHAANIVPQNPPGMDLSKLPELQNIWFNYYMKILLDNMDPTESMNAAQQEAMALFE